MKVYIEKVSAQFMFLALRSINTEISFLCEAERIPEGFLIKTPFIPEQEVSGGETSITVKGTMQTSKFFRERNTFAKCLVHSHVDMGVFQSGGDSKTTKTIMDDIREGSNAESYFITVVTNKKGEFYTLLLLPFWNLQCKLDTEIMEDKQEGLKAVIDRLLEEQLIKEKKVQWEEKDFPGLSEAKGKKIYRDEFTWIKGCRFKWDGIKHDWLPAPITVDGDEWGLS